MLRLGDAVIPAIYLNYILHFLLCGTRKPTSMYFITGMVAYFCSLICATCAALYFRSGQPALFFIVGLITSGPVGDLSAVIHRSTRSWALLGAPCGDKFDVGTEVHKQVAKDIEVVRSLKVIQDPQIEYCLLRHCTGQCQTNFLARMCGFREAYRELDYEIHRALESAVGPLSERLAWAQATLPLRLGGLGIRLMSPYAAAAHCASVGAALKLEPSIVFEGVRMKHYWAVDEALSNSSIATLHNYASIEKCAREGLAADGAQRRFCKVIDDRQHDALLRDAEPRDKVRLLSSMGEHALAWLNVYPSVALRFAMKPQAFRVAVRFTLGVRIGDARICPKCERMTDGFGRHELSCMSGGSKTLIHHGLVNAIAGIVKQTANSVVTEFRAFPADPQIRADLFMWYDGCLTAFDVAVTNPLAEYWMRMARRGRRSPVDEPGYACEQYAETKEQQVSGAV